MRTTLQVNMAVATATAMAVASVATAPPTWPLPAAFLLGVATALGLELTVGEVTVTVVPAIGLFGLFVIAADTALLLLVNAVFRAVAVAADGATTLYDTRMPARRTRRDTCATPVMLTDRVVTPNVVATADANAVWNAGDLAVARVKVGLLIVCVANNSVLTGAAGAPHALTVMMELLRVAAPQTGVSTLLKYTTLAALDCIFQKK